MKNKKVIILWHNGGRMANQIWLHFNVRAYCLAKGYKLENHSFFEYSEDFDKRSNNFLIDLLFFWPYIISKKILPKKVFANQHDNFFRKYYKAYVKLTKLLAGKNVIDAPDSDNPVIHYLPPNDNADSAILDFDNNGSKKIFLTGWLFRNLEGLKKYHKEITNELKPKKETRDKIDNYISDLRKKYDHLVGVHIRQGDYKGEFRDGKLYFNETEVKKILDEYLINKQKDKNKTCFIIFSDGAINQDLFGDLNTTRSTENAIFDLFALAKTDTIIGADSTFGAFASYYGQKPFIIFNRENMDWEYYKKEITYPDHKYLTTLNF